MNYTLPSDLSIGNVIMKKVFNGYVKVGVIEKIYKFDDTFMFKLDKCSDSAFARINKNDKVWWK